MSKKEANPESAELLWTLSVGELLFSFVQGDRLLSSETFPVSRMSVHNVVYCKVVKDVPITGIFRHGGWGKPDFDQVIVTPVSGLRDEVFHTSFIVLEQRVHKARKFGKRKFVRKVLKN